MSVVGYVVSLIVVLSVLIESGMLDQNLQQARVLILVVPLGPFLVLLAYYRWIESITVLGVTIRVPSGRRSDPSPGRRATIVASAALVAAVGGFWRVVLREDDVGNILRAFGLLSPDGEDGMGSDDSPTPEPTDEDTLFETTTDAAVLDADYGERRYGRYEYGG